MSAIDDLKKVITDGEAKLKEAQITITVLETAGEDVKTQQDELNVLRKRIDGLKKGLAKVKIEG